MVYDAIAIAALRLRIWNHDVGKYCGPYSGCDKSIRALVPSCGCRLSSHKTRDPPASWGGHWLLLPGIYPYAHIHICIYLSMYVYIYTYIFKHIYIYMCVSPFYLKIHARYLHTYATHLYIYIYIHIYIYTYIYIYAHMYVCMHMHIYIYTYAYVYVFVHVHAYICISACPRLGYQPTHVSHGELSGHTQLHLMTGMKNPNVCMTSSYKVSPKTLLS